MDKIRLVIVGCGGMGHRHLFGLSELSRTGQSPFELIGVCDPVRENAESLARQAEMHLGCHPLIFGSLEELDSRGIDAVDITTTPRYHHSVVVEALEKGWHVMVEKPMGLTVRACHLIQQAVEKTNLVLSVAENYRRDPMNRLGKALLSSGIIGDPRWIVHQTVGGGDQMTISVWRHQKEQSGVLLDVGVHHADMMEYLLGEIDSVYAKTRLFERVRKNPSAIGGVSGSNPGGIYGQWQKKMPAEFEATAEDAAFSTIVFKNGVVGQYLEDHAGKGQRLWNRQIHGSRGSLSLPPDRSGKAIKLEIDGKGVICDEDLLNRVPDFHLDSVTSDLFGNDRLWCYEFSFPETDRKIIAIEYAEFSTAILEGRSVEVDAIQGMRSVAISYAILESGKTGRLVSVDGVIAGDIENYQREINESLGI